MSKKAQDSYKGYFSSRKTVSQWWREEKWTNLGRKHLDEQLSYVCAFCPWSGRLVLDAGTGFGRFATALGLKGARVVGIDISSDMIELSKSRNRGLESKIDFQKCDVENLAFRNEVFDAVVCIETLMHVPLPSRAVAEIARVTRPGGLVFLSINNLFSPLYFMQTSQIHVKIYSIVRHSHKTAHANRISEVRSWIKNSKLRILDEIGIGLIPSEVKIHILPEISANAVPNKIAEMALSFEKRYDLRRKLAKHLMKAIIVVSEKKEQ